MPNLRKFMVVGVWCDDHSRFADSIEAETPEQAEELIIEQYTGESSDDFGGGLIIAGVLTVVAGAIEVVA